MLSRSTNLINEYLILSHGSGPANLGCTCFSCSFSTSSFIFRFVVDALVLGGRQIEGYDIERMRDLTAFESGVGMLVFLEVFASSLTFECGVLSTLMIVAAEIREIQECESCKGEEVTEIHDLFEFGLKESRRSTCS